MNAAGILTGGGADPSTPHGGGGSSWSLHLFHTPTNAALVRRITLQDPQLSRVQLHRLSLPSVGVAAYNRLLKLSLFWDM